MLPRTHILLGILFSGLVWILFPETAWYNIALVFLSSFLIDFDHYMTFVLKTKKFGLKDAFAYYKKLEREEKARAKRKIFRKGDFTFFHTLEFHALIFALGFLFTPFFYVFAGMAFHSVSDIISLIKKKRIYKREFFLMNWIRRNLTRS